jgi:glycosidase
LSLSACTQPRAAQPEPAQPAIPEATATLPPAAVQTPAAPRAAPASASAEQLPWWNDRVFYEVFVRSFNDSDRDGIGDLNGLIEKLDYLNDGDPATTDDLGVTGIWLMPIMQSPSYHGYDVTDYYTVNSDYGTNADFKRLVEEAHKRGLAVIVDLVLNHTSNEHPWFAESASDPSSPKRAWYRWSPTDDGSRAPWSGGGPVWHKRGDDYYFGLFWEGMPDLNYANPEVTAEMENVTRFWLEEMGVDGFRLDAIRHLIEEGTTYSNTPATHTWWQGYDDFVDSVDPQALTVGEIWDSSSAVAPYVRDDEVDLAFEFDLAQGILTSIQRREPQATAQEVGENLAAYPPGQFATFLTNHDQNRVASELFKDPEGNKLAATLLMTLPGVPFVYYGEEIGMTGSKPDEKIRTPMQWAGDATGGFTTGVPWEPLNADTNTVNVAAQDADAESLLSHYRQLIHLRNAQPALREGEFVPVDSSCPSTFAFMRHLPPASAETQDGQTVLVVVNFAAKGEQTGCTFSYTGDILPAGVYQAGDLLAGEQAAGLTVAASGFQGYAPLPAIEPRAGHVLLLEPTGS